jgi:hypothetical protein
MNEFRTQPFTFDFVNKQVIFETPESLARRAAAGVASPMQFDDERGIILDVFSHFMFGDQSGQCEMDTGSPSSTLDLRYMEKLGIKPGAAGVNKIEKKNLAGVDVVRYDATIPSIALAADPAIKQNKPQVSFSDLIYDCVIGVDFWAGRALTIDIPGHRIIVSSPPEKN